MDENKTPQSAGDEKQASAPFSPAQPQPAPKIVFSRRNWRFLGAAFVLALYPALAFSLRTLAKAPNLPGVGSALFFLAVLAAGVCAVGKRGKWDRANIFVLAAGALCALSLGAWTHFAMRALNHLAAFVLIALGLLSASGMNRQPLCAVGMLWESFLNVFAASFSHFGKPFSALASAAGGKKRGFLGVIAGIGICIPLLAVLIALLGSADAAFYNWMQRIGADFRDINPAGTAVDILRTVFFTLVIFSVFYALENPKSAAKRPYNRPKLPVSTAATVLVLMNLLYVAYFLVVVMGAQRSGVTGGGYARFARSGFFQLVAVSAINLSAVMTTALFHPGQKLRRILSSVLCVQTSLLLAVAAWRMCLYIGAYGLSFLRILTFYFMAVIGCAIVLCIRKDIRPTSKVFPILAAFALALWVLFSMTDMSRIIASYNVDAYLDGKNETVDVDYLSSLSPSAAPALARLAASGVPEAEAAQRALRRLDEQRAQYGGYNWSFDWLALR